ncbi:MAG: hypothetical protein QXM75_03600 [Candidatus Diapherotrites archaeon]
MERKYNEIYCVLTVLLLSICLISTVFADDTAETNENINPETNQPIVDENTQKEITAMNNGIGAKVRLLQLERAILRNILRGNAVISYLEKNYPGEDTSELKTIIGEMRVLKEEVAKASESVKDSNAEVVKTFVDLKNDAISLTKQFRDNARILLEDKNKQGLAEEFKNIDWSEYDELKKEILEKIREYNAKRVEEALSELPEISRELAQKLRNGEISPEEAVRQLMEKLRNLEPQIRRNGFFNLNHVVARAGAFRQAQIIEARRQFLERRMERLRYRLEQLNNLTKDLNIDMNRLRNRIRERIENPRVTPITRISPHGDKNTRGWPR